MHSSTVTVAVLSEHAAVSPFERRSQNDFRIEWFSGTGSGGQHRNKHQNSARIVHVPTGIVRTAQTRSRENSLTEAMAALNAALDAECRSLASAATNGTRRAQVGSGQRSDKVRTYQFQNGLVTHHETGRRAPVERVMSGRFDLLW